MDGFQVAYEINANESLKNIPIVFFTASDIGDISAVHNDSVRKFPIISKPAEIKEIIFCIEKVLGK